MTTLPSTRYAVFGSRTVVGRDDDHPSVSPCHPYTDLWRDWRGADVTWREEPCKSRVTDTGHKPIRIFEELRQFSRWWKAPPRRAAQHALVTAISCQGQFRHFRKIREMRHVWFAYVWRRCMVWGLVGFLLNANCYCGKVAAVFLKIQNQTSTVFRFSRGPKKWCPQKSVVFFFLPVLFLKKCSSGVSGFEFWLWRRVSLLSNQILSMGSVFFVIRMDG